MLMNATSPKKVLKTVFGYDEFRPMQEEIITNVLNKKDTLVLMPTGGGKSVCFQIPAIVAKGTAIVVSPLIALMKDQVESLKANGVKAVFINSSLSANDEKIINKLILLGEIDLLYVSPEKIMNPTFKAFLNQIDINLFAIDEAHCISSWGHDFRPEYTQLNSIKKQFPNTPIIACTATADQLTRDDISKQLDLVTPKVFISSFDRPNISLNVLPGKERFKTILDFVLQRNNQSGIIYCLSRKNTEQISEKLKNSGIKAAHYHAGLNPEVRNQVQEDFINDKIQIICATIAFGMGIDKSNVRWVIHYSLPKNIEGYYQEIGRAGRDGSPSDTLLFYSYADVVTLKNIIANSGQKEVQEAKLERMQQYADALICRRKILLNYFGETLQENCGNCDVCKNPPQQFDGTTIVQKALSAILRTNQKVAAGLLIDILRGSNRIEILEKDYQKIKTHGAGKDISYFDWQQYIFQMLNMGIIDIAYDQHNILRLTPKGKSILENREKVDLVILDDVYKRIESSTKKERTTRKQKDKNDLFETLRLLRATIANEENVPAYIIFTDTTLTEMAEEKPLTEEDFLAISGVGKAKLDNYGDVFMEAIESYGKKNSTKKKKGSTFKDTLKLYQEGLSITEIAKERSLNPMTIYSHLAQLYEEGNTIDIMRFITEEELQKTISSINKIGNTESLKPIFEDLNGEIEYFKIRLAISHFNKN